jgi:hypothetical protein
LTPETTEQQLDAAYDRLHALIEERGDGDFTPQAEQEHIKIVRQIALLSSSIKRKAQTK